MARPISLELWVDGDMTVGGTKFYDRTNGNELRGVMAAQITLDVRNGQSLQYADLTIYDQTGGPPVDVRALIVPAPKQRPGMPLPVGATVTRHEMEQWTRHDGDVEFQCSARYFEVQRDGTLQEMKSMERRCGAIASAYAVSRATSPKVALRQEAEKAARPMAEEMVQELLGNRVQTGGPVPNPGASPFPPNFGGFTQPTPRFPPKGAKGTAQAIQAGAAKQEKDALMDFFAGPKKDPTACDECGGSGYYHGFHGREPCSKGCQPKD